LEWAHNLARKEGIMTGISGGSSFAVAMKVAAKAAPGSVILCMMPDTGERYMTTPLFDAIAEDMDAEENALSQSTPGFHLD
ncbi:MAG: cysteine synthase, partial [Rhodobacteraceae bacterium]|nr:cysteine synthase [Paracoccaceae bacterium]